MLIGVNSQTYVNNQLNCFYEMTDFDSCRLQGYCCMNNFFFLYNFRNVFKLYAHFFAKRAMTNYLFT